MATPLAVNILKTLRTFHLGSKQTELVHFASERQPAGHS